ncbi:unnamed protein product [Calypogeia fissa]
MLCDIVFSEFDSIVYTKSVPVAPIPHFFFGFCPSSLFVFCCSIRAAEFILEFPDCLMRLGWTIDISWSSASVQLFEF